jgi:DNA helicase-2/ATP-dependent DNA helicase PcrA
MTDNDKRGAASRFALSVDYMETRLPRVSVPQISPAPAATGPLARVLAGLNDPQKEAVTHGDGPVLVFAGAGSGKTGVLTRRIAYLVQVAGEHPFSIIAVTFTNKAAAEMRHRVSQLIGEAGTDLTLGTFHSICARILRRERGLSRNQDFTIYDSDDQRAVMRQALALADISDSRLTPGNALAAVSRLKNELITPELFEPRSYNDELVRRVYPLYQDLLRRSNAYDFDDLIGETVELLRSNPERLEYYAHRFRHVLVDEYQDTNHAQYVLVSLIASKHRNLFVVGDNDQAIYGWRGADVRNILEFESQFPDAKAITLDQNYRSTQTILDAAHGVISHNIDRPPKRLWTDKGMGPLIRSFEARNGDEEAQFVAREIRRLVARGTVGANNCAVMYRTNAQSRVLEDAFIHEGVPYRLVGATRFYERREIKDVLAYLRFVANPLDGMSLARIINVLPRKIGDKTIDRLRSWADENSASLWDAVQHSPSIPTVGTAAKKQLALVEQSILDVFRYAAANNVVDMFDYTLERTGYADFVKGMEDGDERWENVQELRTLALDFEYLEPAEGLRELLEHVALVTEADQISDGGGAATLMTLHLAKGLEFDVVFLVGMEDGLFPHSRVLEDLKQLEEERRLCYVGITRARARLYVSFAMSRALMGRTNRNPPSRFLLNVPENLFTPDSNLPRRAWNRSAGTQYLDDDYSDQPAPSPAAISVQSYEAGDEVYHKHFGKGKVVRSTLTGGDEEITVDFVAKNGTSVRKTISVMYSGVEHA